MVVKWKKNMMDFDPKNPFLGKDKINAVTKRFFEIESDFMAAEGYSKSSKAYIREQALHIIQRCMAINDYRPLVPYLAVNYFDRYISRHPLPELLESPEENLKVFAVYCLILAWKMIKRRFSETTYLKMHDIQQETEVEKLILNGLEWRMRPLTPLCFLDYFICVFSNLSTIQRTNLECNATVRIYTMQNDIKSTEFKPSIIAASALLSAASVLVPPRVLQFKQAIQSQPNVENEDLNSCITVMSRNQAKYAILASNSVPQARVPPRRSSGSMTIALKKRTGQARANSRFSVN